MGGRLSWKVAFRRSKRRLTLPTNASRRHARGKTLAMRAIAALLIVAAICIGGFPAMLQYRSARELSEYVGTIRADGCGLAVSAGG